MNNIVKEVISWGEINVDEYPWRNAKNLYEIIVAEIMLIRTPADQVEKVYYNFINKFPNAKSLNNANKNELKKYIKKLGLIWRTEILNDMATYLVETNIGEKEDVRLNELKKIPGIGEYTANAILTFYFNKRAVPVDSNTVRFFERYYNKEFTGESRRNKNLIKMMDNLIPKEDECAVKFNIAFLDFMRKVCTPTNPYCESCILNNKCKYYKNK